MKKFKTCVAGVGFIGAAHIEALRRLGNVDVVAVTDLPDGQAKAEANFVPRGYNDYREMIDAEKPDVVHICTPNSSHYDIAKYAMEHGAAVICEKPFTRTLEQAAELVEYARAHNIVNAVNFNCRWYPQILQCHAMVKSGAVGDLFTIHGSYLQDWLFLDTDYSWRLEPEMSGASRAFADVGSHWLDMAEFISGQRVTEVMADFETFHKTRKKPLKPVDTFSGVTMQPGDYEEKKIETEDCCTVLFRFENGTRGTCIISQIFAGRKNHITMNISGSKCALRWDSAEGNELWIGHRGRTNEKPTRDLATMDPLACGATSFPAGHMEGFADTFKHSFRAIYSAIEKGTAEGSVFADFEAGMREMILCDAVVRSAREGRWVKV